MHEYYFIIWRGNGHFTAMKINRAMVYGFDTPIDGKWVTIGGYKAEGYKIYGFTNRTGDKIVTLVMNTKKAAPAIAQYVYDVLENGKMMKVSLR